MDTAWEGTLPTFAPLTHDVCTDVLVIGGGLTGLLCAHQLHKAGLHVAVAEADRIGSGVSGRTTAKITTQPGAVYQTIVRRYGAPVAKQFYEANREALDAYRAFESDVGLNTCDGFLFSRHRDGVLERERAALQAIRAEIAEAEDVELPFSVSGAIRIPHQAQVQPLRLLARLAQGYPIYEKTRVREIRGQVATTDQGATVTAKAMVVATHFPFLNRRGAYFLKLYQHRAYAVAAEHTKPLAGMYWEDRDDGLTFRQDAERLLIVGGGHRTGATGFGWKAAEQMVRQYYPQGTVTARWATQDCMSLDGIPYIGRYSKHTPHLYVATGFNGWGMNAAMVSALLITGDLTGKPKPWAAVFAPDRTVWHRQLAINAGESFLNLIKPVPPRCPHLGCALKWNKAERSWDCPCHGSRFTENGRLLNGPATGNLKEG